MRVGELRVASGTPPPTPPLEEGESRTIFLGAFEDATRAMGPGLRACIWVRGCPMRCRGCATPEFLEFPEGHPYVSLPLRRGGGDQEGVVREQPALSEGVASTMPPPLTPPPRWRGRNGITPLPYAYTASVPTLCAQLDAAIAQHGITGVSFSGGEPFAQAEALAEVARYARSRGLSTLSWSGFSRVYLAGPRAPVGSVTFLQQLDVLIDGPFVQRRANGDPLRGSSNQAIHFLTDRHRPEDFAESVVEVLLNDDGTVVTTGVMEYAATDPILAILGVNTDDADPPRR